MNGAFGYRECVRCFALLLLASCELVTPDVLHLSGGQGSDVFPSVDEASWISVGLSWNLAEERDAERHEDLLVALDRVVRRVPPPQGGGAVTMSPGQAPDQAPCQAPRLAETPGPSRGG